MKKQTNQINKNRKRSGFSLVELMVVIVIIGLLAGVVGVNVVNMIHKGRVTTAKQQMATFKAGIKTFKIDTSQYPETLDELVTPPDINGASPNGYLEDATEIPLDPWGNEYVYETTGDSAKPYNLLCLGADGAEGGDADNDEDRDFTVKGFLDEEGE